MQREIGPKADVYSADLNYWAFRAAGHLLRHQSDFVYLSTTDYMMHTYAPDRLESLEHMHQVDRFLGAIVDEHPRIEVYVTADHGMNAKPFAVDLQRVLRREGVSAEVVPVIKDRYVKHHGNLGGSCYVYLEQERDIEKTARILHALEGVKEVLERLAAAKRFRLAADRIGDLVVFGARDYCFGDLDQEREPTKVRTHGSLYESTVPLIAYGRKVQGADYQFNFDITRRFVM
jgi:phosphonoacetate hydrolase